MYHRHFVRLKSGVAIAVFMAAAVCWAGTAGSVKLTLANITANGRLGLAAATVDFNYVLDRKGHFVGQAQGKVINHSNVDASFKNVGHITGFTIFASLYDVDDIGNAVFVAAGSKP